MVELRVVRPGGRLRLARQRNTPGMNQAASTLLLILATFGVVSASGCAGSVHSIDAARGLRIGRPARGDSESLTDLCQRGGRFSEAASLDLAMVELAAGEVGSARSRLRDLRDRFDALPKVAPFREAASMVSDDTARLYRPEGYEQVMIRAMLAVCSLADDPVDAESYALQATMKQAELARDAEERGVIGAAEAYQPIAMAPYLRGVLREATHHDYDDANSAYQLVSSVRPQFAPAAEDIARASGGTHTRGPRRVVCDRLRRTRPGLARNDGTDDVRGPGDRLRRAQRSNQSSAIPGGSVTSRGSAAAQRGLGQGSRTGVAAQRSVRDRRAGWRNAVRRRRRR